MKKFLALITFLLFLLLLWCSWNWYKQTVVCCTEEVVEETVKLGPLVYDCDSSNPITNDLWPNKKAELLAEQADGEKLLIVGPYFEGEDESLGLKRAEQVKELFHNDLDIDQIELGSRKVELNCSDAQKNDLHNTYLKWVVRNENVVEHHDKTYIYFKYNTTKEIDTEHVVTYLKELIEYQKETGKSIHITGHTDADGNQEYNSELGLKRATRVKDYLVKNGVAEDKITVETMGKLEPLSTNATEEGKQKNRRVEIEIK